MKQYKFLGVLTVLYVTMQLVSDVTAGKIVQLFIFPVSVTVLYFPVTFIFADVLTEVYGYAVARRVLWTVLLCSFLASMVYQLVAMLPPAPGFEGNDAYVQILGQVPRIVLGSWIAIFFGEILNDFVLAKMKIWTDGRHLWSRLIGSTVVGQLANTVLFYTIALYGVLPTNLLIESIVSGWLLKVVVEVLLIPVTYWIVGRLKAIEEVDYFDRGTNFNPFVITR
jgi:queuosine precursor transporter